jgi:hypothetical protein
MSKIFFQINKGLSLFNQSSAPSDPVNGDQYYDSTLNTMRFYINGTWLPLGTVDSVGLSVPSIFTASGSPVTSSGTLTFSLNTQTAGTVFAGPSSGSAATPTFRALTNTDITVLTSNIQSGTSYVVLSTDTNKVIILTSTSARTVTLPSAPNNNFYVAVKDGSSSADTANITINSSGSDTIEFGAGTSVIINSENESLGLIYSTSNTKWYVV